MFKLNILNMMQKQIYLIFILSVIIVFSTTTLNAQNSVNSPYTRYGYGELAKASLGASRAMGGTGIGLRISSQINPMNPASYSSMDSLTFLFDFGASGQLSWFNDGTAKQKNVNGNVDYIAMQFPVYKKIAVSTGLLPYSQVGYGFQESKTSDGLTYTESFSGTGGLTQLYAGVSLEILENRLAVGGNINYLFGSITHSSHTVPYTSNAYTIQRANNLKIQSAAFDIGLQYTQSFSRTDKIILGLVYSPKKSLGNDVYESEYTSNSAGTVIESKIDTLTDRTFDIPNTYGIGLSYVKANKMIAALDFTYQEWANATFGNSGNEFSNRYRIAAGFEYIPNLYSRPYLNRVRYRAGINYTNSYIKVNGNGYKEYGASLGIGLPISDNRSFINVSFEYMKIKPDVSNMIDENYLRLTVGLTFNEFWFFKNKVQ
jgi:hypothetical protein